MTMTNPRNRNFSKRVCIAGLLGILALSGCKSRDGGGNVGGGSPGAMRDPLVYGAGSRIPPQNVPLPDRGAVGSKGRGDPLTTPTGKTADRTGSGYSDDPERFKSTFNPGPGTTPASLAAKKNDGEELKIDTPDNRVPLRQVGGTIPASDSEPVPPGVDPLFKELEKYGANRADRSLTQENGDYTFRASVPISGNGAKRSYSGVGKTAPEAVKMVLDQVIADRK